MSCVSDMFQNYNNVLASNENLQHLGSVNLDFYLDLMSFNQFVVIMSSLLIIMHKT